MRLRLTGIIVLGLAAGALVTGGVMFLMVPRGILMPSPAAFSPTPATDGAAAPQPVPKPEGSVASPSAEPSVYEDDDGVWTVEITADAGSLAADNSRLRSENTRLRRQLAEVFNWILANFRGTYPLPETQVSKLKFTPVNDDFTIHPDLVEFLHVTDDEQVLMNDAFAYASAVLQELQQAGLTLTKPQPEKVVLHIPPFPDEGEFLREELFSALEVTLGGNRFDRFLDVSEEGLDEKFHHFGNAARTIIFQLTYDKDDGTPRVMVKDGWVIDAGNNQRIIQATESTLDTFPQEYADYLQHLPDEMKLPMTEQVQ